MPSLKRRVVNVVWGALRLLDQIACYLWLAPLHLLGLADAATGTQMISSYAGKAAANGQRWGIRLAAVIDWLALKVGDQPDHCRRSYEFYRAIELP